MAFDMSLVQRGARLRRSPFYEAEQAYSPKGYTVYNHMLFPTNYDDFEAEYWHLLNHVTLWDVAVEQELTEPVVLQREDVLAEQGGDHVAGARTLDLDR